MTKDYSTMPHPLEPVERAAMGALEIFSRDGQVPQWGPVGVWRQSSQKPTTGCENNA